MTVKSSLYAKYYFELRALFKDNEKEFPLEPLNKKDCVLLEMNSTKYKNDLETKNKERGATLNSIPSTKKEWVC